MKLISPREAARRLKVHASTVYRVIDRDEVRYETIRVARLRVQWDEKSEDLRFTSPAFKEKLQAGGGRLALCEVGPFLDKFFEAAQPPDLRCIRGGGRKPCTP
jgi:excisionase family DNA binding protein